MNQRNLIYGLVYVIFTTLVIGTSNFPFFWDTLQLASKHACYFYDNGFTSIILPNNIDSGHIPTLGFYIALVWKIFGKSLLVSHLAMLPFVWGIVYQSIRLTKRLFDGQWQVAALLLLLADATLMAQCTLVSPDVILICFFLMALNYFFSDGKTGLAIALIGLTLASMRGMMCVAALFTGITIIRSSGSFTHGVRTTLKRLIPEGFRVLPVFIPAMAIAGAYFGWHFYKTGWIGYHKDMPWYDCFEMVNAKGAVRNVFITGWRLIDFGRLFIWLAGLVCVWHYFRKRPALNPVIGQLICFFICILIALGQAGVLHKNLAGHRYLLPLYLLACLVVCYYVFHIITSGKVRTIFTIVMLAGLFSGNFWVYPDKVAKGWDATLAYLPYHPLRDKMMLYLSNVLKKLVGL